MNILSALNWRYAVRRFSPQKIDESCVRELLKAVRLSASAFGLQPYRMIVVKDVETRKQLLPYAMGQDKVVDCSHLVILAARTDIGDDMIDRYIESVSQARQVPKQELQGLADHMKSVFAGMSQRQKIDWAHQQAYIALGTLLTSAALMKIDSCPMTGFEPENFDRVLGLAERGLESSVICALGIRHPEDKSASMPKVRYPLSDMLLEM